VAVVFVVTATFIEATANPAWNLGRRGFFSFFSFVFVPISSRRIRSGQAGSDPAGKVG
jgi:hypothetical protein